MSECVSEPASQSASEAVTVDGGGGDVGPDGHRDVCEQEADGDERDEVVELVRTVHHEAQHDDEHVHPEQHLAADSGTERDDGSTRSEPHTSGQSNYGMRIEGG